MRSIIQILCFIWIISHSMMKNHFWCKYQPIIITHTLERYFKCTYVRYHFSASEHWVLSPLNHIDNEMRRDWVICQSHPNGRRARTSMHRSIKSHLWGEVFPNLTIQKDFFLLFIMPLLQFLLFWHFLELSVFTSLIKNWSMAYVFYVTW